MRGTTSRKIIKMLRKAGAKEIHVRISASPTVNPCYYGIDIPTRQELIASTHTIEEIIKYLRVNSLAYLSVESMVKAAGAERNYCKACFDGNYPVLTHFTNGYYNQKSLFEEYEIEEN